MSEYPSDHPARKPTLVRPGFSMTMDAAALAPPLSQGDPGAGAYRRLVDAIQRFEKGLGDRHEVGACLAAFGATETIHLRDLDYQSSGVLVFSGKNGRGEERLVVQHISQLNVLLVAVDKLGDAPARIGFRLQRGEHGEP